jgi:hypothetical protein
MSNKPLAKALAKVIIAAAWADNHLAPDEINSLKHMLAELGQGTGRGDLELTANDWAELDIYLYSPVEEAERARLVQDLAMTLRGPADRKLALEALEHMLHADRVVTEEERQVAEEIRQALSRVDPGIFASIGRLVRGGAGHCG